MSGRSISDATDAYNEFDRSHGVKYFALLLGARSDHDAEAAKREYQHMHLDLWFYAWSLPTSEDDMQKLCEYATGWCLKRYPTA